MSALMSRGKHRTRRTLRHRWFTWVNYRKHWWQR